MGISSLLRLIANVSSVNCYSSRLLLGRLVDFVISYKLCEAVLRLNFGDRGSKSRLAVVYKIVYLIAQLQFGFINLTHQHARSFQHYSSVSRLSQLQLA